MQSFDQIIRNIEQEAPPILTRHTIEVLTGGAVKAKTLANLDCLGGGISERVTVGRKVAYPRAAFVEWLRKKMEAQP